MGKETVALLTAVFLAVLIAGCVSDDAKDMGSPSDKKQPLNPYAGKKVLFIDSYHEGYEWSDGEANGAKGVFEGKGIEFKVIHMDTKRNDSDAFGKQAGLRAKSAIEEFAPDVVIIADDPAFKYVLMSYYKNAGLPFVFAGINWDASVYGAPYNNTAGMVEVSMGPQLKSYLREYSKGDRIGFIAGNTTTDRKNVEYYSKLYNIAFSKIYLVSTFDAWKAGFIAMQNEADMVFLENNAGISDWNNTEAEAFVLANTRIPAGTVLNHMTPYSLIGFTKVAEEQGEWAANAALRIIGGTKPSDIPQAANHQGRLFANLKIAEKLGVTISPYFLKNSELIR